MLISDDHNWWRRYEHRRRFRADQLHPIVVAERGYPCDRATLKARSAAQVWDDCEELVAEHLRAVGLIERPDWVTGSGRAGCGSTTRAAGSSPTPRHLTS